MTGLLIAAPTSGAGKTTVTLGLLRAFRNAGIAVQPAKSGPDYIDPRFHEVACDAVSYNLDAWAMAPEQMQSLAAKGRPLVVEGAMGLFDGAGLPGHGSSYDVARHLDLSLILVVDCAKMAHSVKALVDGFKSASEGIEFKGVFLNRVGSRRHLEMLKAALGPSIPVLGHLFRNAEYALPERHLGLVQAGEIAGLDEWLDRLAADIATVVDLEALCPPAMVAKAAPRAKPPAQRIAIAQDVAFAFHYPHMIEAWRTAGAEVRVFSPLADDPVPDADFVFLPGGYPELHAAKLAGNQILMQSLKQAAQGTDIYGECGGYMLLGDGLIDAQGHRHQMAGLLRLETSFETRKLHLGYRSVQPASPFGPKSQYKAHEFHYASTLQALGDPLFYADDADGVRLGEMGLRSGRVAGSFAHIIEGL